MCFFCRASIANSLFLVAAAELIIKQTEIVAEHLSPMMVRQCL